MKAKVGLHYVARHRNHWSVYEYVEVNDNGFAMSFRGEDFWKYEDAIKRMYQLNGWDQPKTIYKRF